MNRRKKWALAGAGLVIGGAAVIVGRAPTMSVGALLHVGLGWGAKAPPQAVLETRLVAPKGFSVSRFAEGLGNVRFLRFTPAGDLLVSVPRDGKVLLLGRAQAGAARPAPRVLLRGLKRPHGLELHDGWLYVAETDAVARVRFDAQAGQTSGDLRRVVTGLPGGGNHWTRTVRIGPDGWMYVSIGSSCNVCLEEDRRRAAIVRYRPDGSGEELYATGLRNSVGLDFRPGTGELYATDNGRDLLGDDFPPCELNRIVRGGFYGWPYVNGDRVPDPDFGKGPEGQAKLQATLSPAFAFRPHNAPLGLTFLRGGGLPAAYRGAALVALHGSWNRSRKDGYKVVSLHFGADGKPSQQDFLTGFLRERDQDVIGRPVDVAEGPDGAIYISDDYTGSIYRVAYGEGAQAPAPPAAPAPPKVVGPTAAATVKALPEAERDGRQRRGAQLFQKYACAGCHVPGQVEKGVVPHRLDGAGGRYTLPDLTEYFLAPRPPMPAFPLSPEERRDLAVHVAATYP